MSVGLGSDRPFEVSLAVVVKAMESAKAIIREDVHRGGRGRRGDQCCLVHATEDVWVERDAIRKAESPRRSGEVKWCIDARAVHRECFMLMMNSKARIVGRPKIVFVDTSFPRAKDNRMVLLAGVA